MTTSNIPEILRERDEIIQHVHDNPEYPENFFKLIACLMYRYHDNNWYLDCIGKELVVMCCNNVNACHVKCNGVTFDIIMTSNIEENYQEAVFCHREWRCVLKFIEGLMSIC